MNLTEFIQRFPDEQSCRFHLKNKRETDGISCKKCGCTNHYWLQNQWKWQCSKCKYRTSIKSGTMFENSNLPIRMWYLAIAFMCFSKKAVSACELQRQLRHKRYDTVWTLMHRIRNIMGNRDALYYLSNLIEVSEDFLTIAKPDGIELRRRKGLNNKLNMKKIKLSEFRLNPNENCKKKQKMYSFSITKPKTDKKGNIYTQLKTNNNRVTVNDWTITLKSLSEIVEVTQICDSVKQKTASTLWTNITISNMDRIVSGIYHKVKVKYLQLYLDEYGYKLNRRYIREQMFDNMINACIQYPVLASLRGIA
jgi:hypothetical protein